MELEGKYLNIHAITRNAETLKAMALESKFGRESGLESLNSLVESKAKDMRAILTAASEAKDEAWIHSDPKLVLCT